MAYPPQQMAYPPQEQGYPQQHMMYQPQQMTQQMQPMQPMQQMQQPMQMHQAPMPTYTGPSGGPPSSSADVQRFIQARDLNLLAQRPLVFEKTPAINSAVRCESCFWCWGTGTFTAWLWPTALCCPGRMYPNYHLELNSQYLTYADSENDICCNVSTSSKTLPLTSLRSVDVRTGCCVSCCTEGVKQLVVSDGHVTTTVVVTDDACWAESKEAVEARFLKDPDEAAAAINTAMLLARQQPVMMVPVMQVMPSPGQC